MYGRTARAAAAAAALTAAGLVTASPFAQASEQPTPRDPVVESSDGLLGGGLLNNVNVLNDSTVLPVQACGLGVPILGDILTPPSAQCAVHHDDTTPSTTAQN